MNFKPYSLAFATALLLLLSPHAHAAFTFDFVQDDPFDGGESGKGLVGASVIGTDLDTGIDVTLETIEIIGQNGSLASSGDPDTDHKTNVQANVNSLGINDDTNPGGYSNESRDFNPGEAWVISFDVDVNLVEIDLAGQDDGALLTISSTAFSDVVLGNGESGDVHNLGELFVTAGTTITLQMSADSNVMDPDTGLRVDSLTVGTIPEPSSFLLAGCAVLFAFGRGNRLQVVGK
ncbi:hypothetical protein [Adhaeretor mobilis]|uniref:PEP-CTERM protein-sorting domain-containing protein n=1 Tax=Adhaeretor mobilis TaxID=1930276 RepID=A0A517N1N7_9BACT|nr:hypothetical protein [Adhaeretor mobilis]QDT00918.1 hypothetical protein HG15A2_42600 [Adhaeretor mobilis]